MILGDIIRVEDSRTYLAKIQPDAKKERVGSFVKIMKDESITVGVIKNITHSIREELIPYIEPEKQPKYAPFNEDFRNSYYVVHGLGEICNGIVKYEIASPPEIGDDLLTLSRDELKEFHTCNGKPSVAYFHANRYVLGRDVLLGMIETIKSEYPECSAMLKLVRKLIERGGK